MFINTEFKGRVELIDEVFGTIVYSFNFHQMSQHYEERLVWTLYEKDA